MVDEGGRVEKPPERLFFSPERYLKEIVNVNEEAARIYLELFEGLPQYCVIPNKFSYCKLITSNLNLDELEGHQLEMLIDQPNGIIYKPQPPHYEALKFFKKLLSGDEKVCEGSDPLRPKYGAYLFGPPGTGKTHLMTAYAIELKKLLDQKLNELWGFLKVELTAIYQKQIVEGGFSEQAGIETAKRTYTIEDNDQEAITMEKVTSGETALARELERLRKEINKYKYKPTDIVYIGFDPLYEMCKSQSEKRQRTLEALIQTPVVFIDDVHPKGDIDRATVISHILERRYDAGNVATFLTTNLSDEKLGAMFNDKNVTERLHSRFSEMFYPLDFKGCIDWRIKVNKIRIDSLKADIAGELRKEGVMPRQE